MYWDVVEVKAEPGYRLWVRFKDGLAGLVQLRPEELTGVLEPLLDTQFFEQVFTDCGAVAWPGEIDLAPDAMYAQIASQGHIHIEVQQPEEVIDPSQVRSRLPRIFELKDLLTDPAHPGTYFRDFDEHLKNPACFATYAIWEENLQSLDSAAWEDLKARASSYLKHSDVKGRKWQQLFNVLGEASGYRYLKELEGCSAVHFIPTANDDETPDLEGVRGHERVLCEVKTINISDVEVKARREPSVVRNVSDQLEDGFFRKLDSDIAKSKSQLESYEPKGEARHLVYINICFDDFFGFYNESYLQQVKDHLLKNPPGIRVVLSLDTAKTETHVVAQQ